MLVVAHLRTSENGLTVNPNSDFIYHQISFRIYKFFENTFEIYIFYEYTFEIWQYFRNFSKKV